ncbi:MAG: cyanophycinase [Bryobacteraceae bacterium]
MKCSLVLLITTALQAAIGYDYYLTGNPADSTATPQPGLVLMGGGTDVNEAFRWMIQRSGGGDFVILRATGSDGYNPYVWALGNVDSVETFVIKTSAAASDPFILKRVRKAEAVFIAGGDQSDYMRLWSGTPLQTAMQEASARIPFGGTSAGLAVLGQWVYTGQRGSVTSDQALRNPYHPLVTLAPALLSIPGLQGYITDSHFSQRDRMGRLVVFLARLVEDSWTPQANGIGVDEQVAILLTPDGIGQVVGNTTIGSAYVLRSTARPELCDPRQPLTFRGLLGYRLPVGSSFNFATGVGTGVVPFGVSAVNGVLVLN